MWLWVQNPKNEAMTFKPELGEIAVVWRVKKRSILANIHQPWVEASIKDEHSKTIQLLDELMHIQVCLILIFQIARYFSFTIALRFLIEISESTWRNLVEEVVWLGQIQFLRKVRPNTAVTKIDYLSRRSNDQWVRRAVIWGVVCSKYYKSEKCGTLFSALKIITLNVWYKMFWSRGCGFHSQDMNYIEQEMLWNWLH